MATTTNYSWTTPDNTAYVKDGASAIRSLGSSVDSTLFTALGGAYPGLRLIKKQAITAGVSSITVTGAFSATYDAYKIIVSGGAASGGMNFGFRMGTANTGYYAGGAMADYAAATITNNRDNNSSQWTFCGYGNTNTLSMNLDLNNPFLAKNTFVCASYAPPIGAAAGGMTNGFKDDSTSYTSFTLLTQSAVTFSSGTIYVYGYGAS